MPSVTIGSAFLGPNGETFKISDFLGRGYFGEVYRAEGQTTGQVVAVKLLPLGALSSAESKVALLNEIATAQQIKHPNVVEVLYVSDGAKSAIGPYVVMEYISGGSLAKMLRAMTQIPLEEAYERMLDIAQGVRAINKKLIHRDIKPDNILIESGKLKIADFGISKFVNESTRLHTFKGRQHVAYMAPEAWQNETNTISLDIYSTGLVFYEILSLKHPLQTHVKDPSNFLDWEKAHLYQPCPDIRTSRSEVSLSVAQLLSRMVSKRPGDRPYWDEIIAVLSRPASDSTVKNPIVTAAVEAAVARDRELTKQQLDARAQQDERERQVGLFKYSCGELIEKLGPVVAQFNDDFQKGKITRRGDAGWIEFNVPSGQTIQLSFFQPRRTGIKLRNGEVIGGGWLGLVHGRSANLVLVKQGTHDLYGTWVVCEIRFMALVDPYKLFGKFGLTQNTIEPFGFKAEYFYDQIQYANGTMHAFTYSFVDDVVGYFAQLIHEALK